MKESPVNFKDKRKLESILLICALVVTSVVIILPMTAPKVMAITHDLPSAAMEDNQIPYDIDMKVGFVQWDPDLDHIVTVPQYTVSSNFLLTLGPMKFMGDPDNEKEISFVQDSRIVVQNNAALQVLSDGEIDTKTAFIPDILSTWDGIYFQSGSHGKIDDVLIQGAQNGIYFESGSNIIAPGINNSVFEFIARDYGLRLENPQGERKITDCFFLDWNSNGVPLRIGNSSRVDIERVEMVGHRPMGHGIEIENSEVHIKDCFLDSNGESGNQIFITRDSTGTEISSIDFLNPGIVGAIIHNEEGASPLIVNCSFPDSHYLSVFSNHSMSGNHPSPIVLNPTSMSPGEWGKSFSNYSLNASGEANVTLQWYMNVYVDNSAGLPISGALVNVSAPSTPSNLTTDTNGFAGWFIVTEFVRYYSYDDNYNPFNVSADNGTKLAYAEPTMDYSKQVNVTFVLPHDPSPPELFLPPTWIVTDTEAIINWTTNEAAFASVWYGLDDTLTTEQSGSSGSTLQSVTLTGLQPGRKYTFAVNSTNPSALSNSSYPTTYVFYTEVHIPLYEGWNMISVPPNIPNPSITVVLSPIAGLYDAVQWYDASDPDDPWKQYIPGKPFGNDLEYIYPDMGIWILMNTDAVFIPNQNVPTTGSSTSIPLVLGWNFVGYPSATTRLVDDALTGVSYEVVQTYDAATRSWWSYDGTSGDLTVMEMGRGYWIYVTVPTSWNVYYV